MSDSEFFNWFNDQKTINENNCWIWNHGKNSSGYGCVSFHKRMTLVHRISFELKTGKKPEDEKDIRHICPVAPNTLCYNPLHLIEGTRKDNMEDMVLYGRSQTGEKNYHSKLTDYDVTSIRAQKGMFLLREFAEMYGVDQALISMILNNKIWKHINALK